MQRNSRRVKKLACRCEIPPLGLESEPGHCHAADILRYNHTPLSRAWRIAELRHQLHGATPR